MAKAGIQRFTITDPIKGRGRWRFEESKSRHEVAASLYRSIFDGLGMPLLPGYERIKCTLDDFKAGYDYELGIDVNFNFTSGMTATLQEKFLYVKHKTVTVEYMQNWRTKEQGDWFNMKPQYYFVGYDRRELVRTWSKDYHLPVVARKLRIPLRKIKEAMREDYNFQDWILLDWSAVMMETSRGNIIWGTNKNTKDGALASFRYAPFTKFPDNCIVAERDMSIELPGNYRAIQRTFWSAMP